MREPSQFFVAACVVASQLALIPSSHGQEADRGVAGTWVVTVTVTTPPGAPPFVFTDLIAFNSGGTLTATSSAFNAHTSENQLLPAPLVVDTSDGYGTWQSGDDSHFSLTFKRFLFAGVNTSSTVYGPFSPGQNVGVNAVQAIGTLNTNKNADSLTGSFSNQFINLSGDAVFAGSGTFTAKRLTIEPLMQ